MATITLTNVQMRYCNLVKPYEPKVGAPKYTLFPMVSIKVNFDRV